MDRKSQIIRKTAETDISLTLSLDGTGKTEISSGCPFLDHMLTLFACHGRFDLTVNCKGDVEVDYHHTTEAIGLALGQAIAEALGISGASAATVTSPSLWMRLSSSAPSTFPAECIWATSLTSPPRRWAISTASLRRNSSSAFAGRRTSLSISVSFAERILTI